MKTDKDLKEIRDRIDAIDESILRLINDRLSAAKSIAQIKGGLDEPTVYRPEREAQVLSRLKKLNSGLLGNRELENLFREIMSISRHIQAPLTVSLLGPPGTYSEAAARQHFGSDIDIVDFPIIDEIFKATENGQTDFSVVPIENSTEGGVTSALDRLITTSLTICGEINFRINHNLMSRGDDPSAIKTIYAHTQSLGQCKRWIDTRYPTVKRVPVSSNADAAARASAESGGAAIAGEMAAVRYGLNILFENIEDESGNTTRFLILSNRATPPSGHDKTSLLLSCRSRPGALVHLLTPLLEEGIDMTRIESRPSRISLWDYVFFIDFLGHEEDERVARALSRIRSEAGLYKSFGSYPATIQVSNSRIVGDFP